MSEHQPYPTHPVGDLQHVLAALADPVRLEIVRRLRAGAPVACSLLYEGVSKSTASHHFKILREAGVTQRSSVAGQPCQQLRLGPVEARHPGVLSAIIAAAPEPTVPESTARQPTASQPVETDETSGARADAGALV